MEASRQEELLSLNLAAWESTLAISSSLDTSLKKNTAFVKKLTTSITKDRHVTILKEISTLSLKKYEAEIILTTQEALFKCTKLTDLPAAVEVVCALHQKFGDSFTSEMMSWFLSNLANPSSPLEPKEEKERISKVKVLLRLFMELHQVGVFRNFDEATELPSFVNKANTSDIDGDGDGDMILVILKECLSYKLKTGQTLTIAVNFVKRYSAFIKDHEQLKSTLTSFTAVVAQRAHSLAEKVAELTVKRNKAQIRTGRVNEEWETALNETTETFELFKGAAEVLCPEFNIILPDLSTTVKTGINGKGEDDEDSVIVSRDSSVWNSDEDKRFYTTFPEIPEELISSAKHDTDSNKAGDMNEFLASLDISQTNKEIDACVLKFWELKLVNKASLNRLLRHFTSNKDFGRAKVYARFLKCNETHLTDLITELLSYLDQGFRSQIYHNGLNFRNIVFFSEMIKFQLIPTHVVFHKIRSLILSLSTPNNIEILSIFFEIAGKFLLATQTELMEEMLTLLQEKRKSDKLTANNRMAIANLFLLLKPPSVKSLKPTKQLTPQQQFLKLLIRSELTPSNHSEVKKIITLTDFTDPLQSSTLLKLFIKPDKISYENITSLSHLLRHLPRTFRIQVIDTILDEIITGMEINDYRLNRIRVSQVKYIAEMFVRKLISQKVMLALLFKILSFGHFQGQPHPRYASEVDPSDDYFRIQMITVILTSIHSSLKPKQLAKFEEVLIFLDYYIWCKDSPMPMEFQFKVAKCYELYGFKGSTQEEGGLMMAVERLREVVERKRLSAGVTDEEEEEEEEFESEDEEDEENEEEEDDSDSEDEEDGSDSEDEDLSDTDSETAQDEEEQSAYELYERKLQIEEDKKLESQLDKEFKRMVFESLNSSRGSSVSSNLAKPIVLDVPLTSPTPSSDSPTPSTDSDGKVRFRLVTKKGKTTMTKDLQLPSHVSFASNILMVEERRSKEKESINRYILQSKFDDDD